MHYKHCAFGHGRRLTGNPEVVHWLENAFRGSGQCCSSEQEKHRLYCRLGPTAQGRRYLRARRQVWPIETVTFLARFGLVLAPPQH